MRYWLFLGIAAAVSRGPPLVLAGAVPVWGCPWRPEGLSPEREVVRSAGVDSTMSITLSAQEVALVLAPGHLSGLQVPPPHGEQEEKQKAKV